MHRIAFLACQGTLPGSPARRVDAFEHDRQVAALCPAFAAAGLELVEIDWRAPIDAFEGVPLALLGTVWDYQDREDEFLARMDALAKRGVQLCNPPALIRWNIDKAYLRELEGAGIATIPTLWLDDPAGPDIAAAFDRFGCDRLVVKRRVGAGAEGQICFDRASPPAPGWRYGTRAMVQPFLPAIVAEGEVSMIFVDGAFSHAVRKRAKRGDYRIQSSYGGTEEAVALSDADIAAGADIVRAMPGATPLYARVDMLRDGGTLLLMEAEVIEPYLYPQQGPQLGERMARGVLARLAG